MTLVERHSGHVAIIDVDGRITEDEDADVQLRDTLHNLVMRGETAVLLNLARVPVVDSSGLGAVAHAYISAKRHGGSLKLMHVSSRVHDLLVITRLGLVFEVFDGEEEGPFGPDVVQDESVHQVLSDRPVEVVDVRVPEETLDLDGDFFALPFGPEGESVRTQVDE